MGRVIYHLLLHKKRVKRKPRVKKKEYKDRRCVEVGDECDMGIQCERVRALTIKENLEKMKQLGLNMNILDQAKRVFHQDVPLPMMEKKKHKVPTVPRFHKDAINRRTFPRLMKKHPSSPTGKGICIDDNGKMKVENEKVYTSEHEKLLGNSNSLWTLFDDQSVKRLYDSINGITCHQCRQKTIDPRTECSLCHRSHGRLCGKYL
ncbi:UNVERIFIED_CONTAM: Cell division cycle-associated protein 7 [Sesamum indicum]